ncbi:MAG: ABC transporter, permease protein 2 RSc1752 [uncultured Paraburkholderia sp.]|nr:MAG: ABC transporter, permease protein 2 RSc1752 [uncultured Paraburkholderia sp.]CAH2925400.1 MAG: ABC transporter, permease protein 2 RSc1752 [uncultured Paraburkholderia sp.]
MREPSASVESRTRWRVVAPWLALVLFLTVPPFIWPQSWLLAYLVQTAAMIVFALSYNLLLGESGLLSFGHAAYSGLGALIAAQMFNRIDVPLPLLPLAGGIGGMLCAVVLGFVSTRRAGTAFAMIMLGIGELVGAAAWTLPDWFGGEAGVPIDRTSGPWPSLAGWTFGPAREAYALIVLWCLLASVAMFALSRTPFMRIANAVRDNPARAAAMGCYPRRIRYAVVVVSAFFAGIAGTLGLINVELVSTESVSMARSGAVLIAMVIGGTGAFFGSVAGTVVLTFSSAWRWRASRADRAERRGQIHTLQSDRGRRAAERRAHRSVRRGDHTSCARCSRAARARAQFPDHERLRAPERVRQSALRHDACRTRPSALVAARERFAHRRRARGRRARRSRPRHSPSRCGRHAELRGATRARSRHRACGRRAYVAARRTDGGHEPRGSRARHRTDSLHHGGPHAADGRTRYGRRVRHRRSHLGAGAGTRDRDGHAVRDSRRRGSARRLSRRRV